MNAIQHLKTIIKNTFILSLLLTLLTACGGGGGGGNSGPTFPSITYTGANTAASLTSGNAADFPITMLEGSSSSTLSAGLASGAQVTASSKNAQHAVMLGIFAKNLGNILNAVKTSGNAVSAATINQNGTCPNHPGTATAIDNSTQTTLNGSLTLNNFCIGDINSASGTEITFHGRFRVTGTQDATDPNAPIYHDAVMTIDYLRITVHNASGIYSEEFSGTMSVTYDGTVNNTVTSMTVSTNFQVNGLTYKISNLVVNKSASTFSVSGRFYHPTHGYVDITTTEPFDLVSTNPDKYCSGTMQVSGIGGTAEFIANADCSQYQVTFTATGNTTGTPDYDSGLVAWP